MYSIYIMYFENNIRFGQRIVLIQSTGKASRKSDIDQIVFIQNHPYGKKMLAKY